MIKTEYFHQLLLKRQEELSELAKSSSDAAKPVELDQTRVGRLSRMDAMQGQEMSLEAARRRRQELKRINQALMKLEAGEYGECESCGEEIAKGRLEIDPAALLCINCAE